ncbi:MAG: DUF1015 domain-containing protein [Oscillospiraceae bacterium]|jgi:uncharacterized protein (DUF1015 family)
MAEIKAFRGLRYCERAGELNKLVCPPYDIISDSQREAFINTNPYNIIRLELPKGENAYSQAGETLKEWFSGDILKKDDKNGIYVYEMEFSAGKKSGIKVKGFISLVKLEEFSKGIILPHEETLSKAKTDRFNLMSETFCNFSQIYSLYMDDDNSAYSLIDKASNRAADAEITDGDGVIHRMWCVYDEAVIAKLSEKFTEKKLYIADGHHRYETALNFHKHLVEIGKAAEGDPSGYVCMMLVNMENDGLVVFPTHRIVRDLVDFNADILLKKCEKYFDITPTEEKAFDEKLSFLYEKGEKAFGLYCGDEKSYIMVLKNKAVMKEILTDKSDAYCGLDVSVLHSLVLERIFGIDKENMANQKNLTYTKIADEAIAAVKAGNADCAFILNPTRVTEIRDVALANEKMPQKSTYFYPKLITGLVMNKFTD